MAKPKTSEAVPHTGRRVLLLLFFLLLLYVIVPRLGNFSASFDAVKRANVGWMLLACVFVIATYCFAAATYCLVALKPRLYYGPTLAVQAASAFANRLLPAGLGGLTLGVQYLRTSGYKTAPAAVVATVNNLLGGVGHFLLFGIVLLVSRDTPEASPKLPDLSHGWLILAVTLGSVAVSLVVFKTVRKIIAKVASQVWNYLAAYRKKPRRLLLGVLSSIAMTACYAIVLYLSALSLGAELSILQVFVVFTLGVIGATAAPTPGGLVGAEAGLVVGLVAYGVEGPLALAIALLYRFLTYWLPLLPGFLMFVLTRRLYFPK